MKVWEHAVLPQLSSSGVSQVIWEGADEGFFGTTGCPSPQGDLRACGHLQGSSSGCLPTSLGTLLKLFQFPEL